MVRAETLKFSLIRSITLLLTFFTGATALIYEVIWQRSLSNFLGSAAQATALILAVFLGGLCAGYHFFGKASVRFRDSNRKLLLLCGLSEIGIGIWAWIFPYLYSGIWALGGIVDPYSAFSLLWEISISIFLIALPTILMGGTLPLITQSLSQNLSDSRVFHARLYAINTAGAFFGCLLAGFYLLPSYGLSASLQGVSFYNIFCGLLICLLSYFLVDADKSPEKQLSEPSGANLERGTKISGSLTPKRARLIAAGAGFCSLSLQTIFIRLTGIAIGSSEYAFAMIVAVFISMLSLGSWLSSMKEEGEHLIARNQTLAFLGALAVYLSVDYWPYIGYLTRLCFDNREQALYLYHLNVFLVLGLVLAWPVGVMGATMPRLFGSVITHPRDIGKTVGELYAWNTVGCVLGAIVGGFALLYLFDLDAVFRLCLFVFLINLAFSLPWSAIRSARRLLPVIAAFSALFALVLLLPQWDRDRLGTGLFRSRSALPSTWAGAKVFYSEFLGSGKQIFYRDGPSSSVSVSEYPRDTDELELNDGVKFIRNLKVNGKSDGETSMGDTLTMRLLAHLPILLSKNPVRKVGVVGFGLGVAAGSATLYPEVESVDVMEISPAVIWASPLFDFANYEVTKNPKVRIRLGDAYRALLSSHRRYSVILSEPSNPWVTGVERLFSKEFYSLVKDKLERGGIYAQWIHEYSISEETLGLVLRTFSQSFRNVRIFRVGRDVILLGSSEEINLESLLRMESRYAENQTVRKALHQLKFKTIPSLLGLELWFRPEQFPGDYIQTLDFPRLALLAGRDFFTDVTAYLPDMLRQTSRRLWAKAAARRSLISLSLKRAPDPTRRLQSLYEYAETACDLDEMTLKDDWKNHGDPCQMSLASLVLNGMVEAEDKRMEDFGFGLVRSLLPAENGQSTPASDVWEHTVSEMSGKEAETVFSLYEDFDSIFLTLPLEKLRKVGATCKTHAPEEAARCQGSLVRVLAMNGYPKAAEEELKELRSDPLKYPIKKSQDRYLELLIFASRTGFGDENIEPALRGSS